MSAAQIWDSERKISADAEECLNGDEFARDAGLASRGDLQGGEGFGG